MFIRHLLAAPGAVDPYALAAGRIVGTVVALVALGGVIAGGLALARAAGRNGNGARRAIVALAAGLTGIVGGGVVLAVADGGPGTGNGVVGGGAAVVLGLIAMALGRLALTRSRRTVA